MTSSNFLLSACYEVVPKSHVMQERVKFLYEGVRAGVKESRVSVCDERGDSLNVPGDHRRPCSKTRGKVSQCGKSRDTLAADNILRETEESSHIRKKNWNIN